MADNANKANNEKTGDEGIPTANYGGEAVRPGEQIGPYKLLRILGEGGYGIVYLAERQRPVKRRVALKVIKPGMDTKQVIARFEAERQALALLDHPNIAHVFNAGTTDAGRPYFAMEYVKGVPITEHCDRYKLTIEERLKLFLSVCEAVQHAHQKAIIHRDIKPSNILVAFESEQAVPMIIDFGVAKALTQSLTERTLVTEQAQMVGTPEYMSPEQAEMTSQDIDTRTDIYSLGVLLYELLTGTLPFDPKTLRGGGPERMRRMIREQDPQTPSARLSAIERNESLSLAEHRHTDIRTLGHRLHGELDWITLKAMDKDRTRRYQTAHALAEDIQRYLNQEPVLAGPPSTVYKLRKFAMRNRSLVTSVIVIVLVLLLATVVSISQMVRANRAAESERVAAAAARAEKERAVQAEEVASKERNRAQTQELNALQRAYSSDMNLAAQALSVHNLGRARELLNRHRPVSPATTDLRGWEWRYLWNECQSQALYTLRGKEHEIYSLSISHDGNWLAIGGWYKGGVSIWDLQTREEFTTLFPDESFVRAAFSPQSNLLAIVSIPDPISESVRKDRQHSLLRFLDWTTRREIFDERLDGMCIGLEFSNDGNTLVTLTTNFNTLVAEKENENQITLWSVPQGEKLDSFPSKISTIIQGRLFTVAHDLSFALHPAREGKIRNVDLSTGTERWSETATEENICALALTRDSKILASGAGFTESVIRLWDAALGKEISRLDGHHAWISDLLFCQDDKILVSASGDQTIRVWDVNNPLEGKLIRTLYGHSAEVWKIALLQDNKTLISGDKNGWILIWDLDAPKQGNHTIIPNITTFGFTSDGKGILALDRDGNVVQYQGADFKEKHELFSIGDDFDRYLTCISPMTGLLATTSTNNIISIWNLTNGTLYHRFSDHTGTEPIAFIEKGKRLVTVNRNRDSHDIWDLSTGQKIQSWSGASELYMYPPAISRDERWLLTLSELGDAHVLKDLATGHETHPVLDTYETSGAVFSPDGNLLAASSYHGFVRVWNAKTYEKIATYRGFLMGVHSVTFSPNGRRLAAGGDGIEAVKIWDVKSHQELLTLPGMGSIHYRIAFSADGNILGSLNRDAGMLHLWRAPSWEEIEKAEKVASDMAR